MINTYNENLLHLTLKNTYADKTHGKTEQKTGKYISDIVTGDGSIIEIQTGNVGKLKEKLQFFAQDRNVTLVYPVPCVTYIDMYAADGERISHRKSPKKADIYSIIREIAGLNTLLLHPRFTLEAVSVVQTEMRVKTDKPVQLPNKSRRFLKDWYKKDKFLNEILDTRTFSGAHDYLSLLPESLPAAFCAADLQKVGIRKNSHYLLWLFAKIGLITPAGKKGNTKFYSIAANYMQ